MDRIPVITGIGLVTPLGSSVEETWNALLAGRFIRTHARCPLDATSPGRVHHLAIAAAQEALTQAHWESRAIPDPVSAQPGRGRPGSPQTAVVVGTSKGAVETWLTAPPEVEFLSSVASAVRARFPLLDGPSLTVSAACASGLHALIRAAMMIQSGEADRVLVVAAEASVHPLFLGSFQRLGVLAPEEIGCRPFDEERDGFLMSEAAAAVCLECADDANSYARVDRGALLGDATHMTATDPDGAALRRTIRSVVAGGPIDFIHAHGTGTLLHDPIEMKAIVSECPDTQTVYSHKEALGHSLGASGLIAVALSCLMHRNNFVPAPSRPRKLIPAWSDNRCYVKFDPQREIRRSLCISSGFGGAMAAVTLAS